MITEIARRMPWGTVVVTQPGGTESDAALFPHLDLRRLPATGLPARVAAVVRFTLSLLTALKCCVDSRPRIFMSGYVLSNGLVGWLAKRLFGVRHYLFVYAAELMRPARCPFVRRLMRMVISDCDGVFAISGFTAGLAAGLGARPAGLHVVPLGIDLRRFEKMPVPSSAVGNFSLAGRKVLLTVAHLGPRKGIDMTIRALPKIAARHDVVYVVVGEGRDRGRLEALASETGVADRVVFTGGVGAGELLGLYARADAFAMPSRTLDSEDAEGFGLVFLEANAAGLGVVAGNSGGIPDAVRDGENGFLVDPCDPDAIAEKIVALLDDPGIGREMSRRGIEYVKTINNWDNCWKAIERVLDEG